MAKRRYERSKRNLKMTSRKELAAFVAKVETIQREDGLPKSVIAERLGVNKYTLLERLKRFRGVAQPG